MLIEFKCKNFLSFKEEISLNLTTIESYSELSQFNVTETKRSNFNLLKSIAIFGSNGGGKSNLTRAVTLMKNLIHNSFSDSLKKDIDRGEWNVFFRLCSETINKPSTFEMSFIIEDIIYRYGFEVYDWKINKEWLFRTEKRETLLFKRDKKKFTINDTGFPEGSKYDEINSNVLFLSYLAQHNNKTSKEVFNFFSNLNVVNGLEDSHFHHVTKNLLKKDKKFNQWLMLALQFLEINSVSISKDGEDLLTERPIYDKKNILEGFTDFKIEVDESDGTKKLIYLLGAIYDTLKWGRVFFIDEFDSKLHPNLSLKIVKLFHKYNKKGAQFIITAHDPTLLDKDVFRRDQIWFVDRNQFGASELYPMSNFKASDGLRNISDFRKKYLNSDFGAAESIELTKEFISMTNKI